MCFNSFTSNLPPLFYDGAQLPFTDSFKFLGMVCDRHINLNTAADAALRPFTAGTSRIRQFIRERDLTNSLRLHICMWLLKTYATPAGMYASQVWATPFLRQGIEMDNPLQKWLMTVPKRILMVKDTTPSWCVMRKCGLESLYNSTGSGRQCDYTMLYTKAIAWNCAHGAMIVGHTTSCLL